MLKIGKRNIFKNSARVRLKKIIFDFVLYHLILKNSGIVLRGLDLNISADQRISDTLSWGYTIVSVTVLSACVCKIHSNREKLFNCSPGMF